MYREAENRQAEVEFHNQVQQQQEEEDQAEIESIEMITAMDMLKIKTPRTVTQRLNF